MLPGRYIGHHTRTGAVLVMTTQGVLRGMAFNRRPEGERWTTDDWDRLKGLPWDMVPRTSAGREAEVFADKEAVGLPITPAPPQPSTAAPGKAKERYVLRADIDKFGPTPDCSGCADYTAKGLGTVLTAQRAHNPECRERIGKLEDLSMPGASRLLSRVNSELLDIQDEPSTSRLAGAANNLVAIDWEPIIFGPDAIF